ncbi:MAG: hypothetical protein QM813_28260 [Verrucomicrobiota bacterium]
MRFGQIVILAALLWIFTKAPAQVTYTTTTSADAFLPSGSANNPTGSDLTGLNFGGAGTLVIAPANSVKGEFQSVIKFNLAGAANLFNASFGTNNWIVTSLALELTSNYGAGGVQPNNPIFNVISGGKFVIEWLANDDWLEGTGNPNLPTTDGVTYDSLPDLLAAPHEILATNTYVPPGVNVHVTWLLPLRPNLVADVATGSDASFLLYAADEQINYLFNSHSYGRGNEPLLHVTAVPRLKILSGYFAAGAFHLTGSGVANAVHQIQTTTNLATANWQSLGTVVANDAGLIEFEDAAAVNHPQRFYRISD